MLYDNKYYYLLIEFIFKYINYNYISSLISCKYITRQFINRITLNLLLIIQMANNKSDTKIWNLYTCTKTPIQ